ncbi:MAG: hypothetical protein ABL858_07180 [Candidatus Nitrotoga sp.]
MNSEPSIPETTTLAAPDVEVLLVKARAVFTDKEQERGTPEAPTQAGFLALARAGKEVWNAWRKAYPIPRADFNGLDFRGDIGINFSGFSFGNGAMFNDAQFGNGANFDGAQFDDGARFHATKFGNGARFHATKFGNGARFSDAQFGNDAMFNGAQFDNRARFCSAQFGNSAMFNGAQFGNGANFDGAQFGNGASFAAWDELITQNFWRERGGEEFFVQQRGSYAGAHGLRSDAFHGISFRGAQFKGDVSFQGRTFLSKTDFGQTLDKMTVKTPDGERVIPKGQPTRFKGIPNFHGCTLYQNTSFDHAEFLAPPSAETARAYRTLKLAFAQQHAIREEQRFFKLEMQAETGIVTGHRKRLYQLYEIVSDYGFSHTRPFKYWLYCLVGFALIYGLLTGTYGWNGNISWERTMQWAHYALLNAVPLPGFDKTLEVLRGDLFPRGATIQLLLTVLEILHKTFSLLAFFLIGLALRNLFKMKG